MNITHIQMMLLMFSRNKKELRKERALNEGMTWDSDEYDADPDTFKQKYKTMVTYERGADRGLSNRDKMDNRSIGMAHDE